jgi:hypothetical protein
MAEKTKGELERVIVTLAGKINSDVKADDALKYTQAALNAANAIRTLSDKKS